MRRVLGIMLAVLCTVLLAAAVFAEENKASAASKEMKGPMMMQKPGMMEPGKMPMDKCSMQGMMMNKMMMQKSLAPTGDGGIVVMAGNKLLKYDKDLNLVKEVTIPMEKPDMEGMEAHHKKMMMREQQGMEPGAMGGAKEIDK